MNQFCAWAGHYREISGGIRWSQGRCATDFRFSPSCRAVDAKIGARCLHLVVMNDSLSTAAPLRASHAQGAGIYRIMPAAVGRPKDRSELRTMLAEAAAQRLPVTPRGAGMPPSKLGLRPGQTISVEDAILALVTRSANDVASAMGAFLAGTEDDFAIMMTKRARELGMSRTTYKNASGLPNNAQKTTARDQATLAKRIREDFPQYYHYFSTEYFVWGKSRIGNHNRLLGKYEGTTGLKTGYTNASGFNLTATVERDDKFLIGVVMG
ncbi:MAG: hypothetical protein CVV20_04055, partial [Gemmatimonadetes bacterium HGW-Gemmatimonadetes-1]